MWACLASALHVDVKHAAASGGCHILHCFEGGAVDVVVNVGKLQELASSNAPLKVWATCEVVLLSVLQPAGRLQGASLGIMSHDVCTQALHSCDMRQSVCGICSPYQIMSLCVGPLEHYKRRQHQGVAALGSCEYAVREGKRTVSPGLGSRVV